MLSDYKFKFISRNGTTTKCRVGFYEGGITSEEKDGKLLTQYRRTKLLRIEDYEFLGNLSDKELRIKLNMELAKDLTRTPIDAQKHITP